jgi:hypothetical protein
VREGLIGQHPGLAGAPLPAALVPPSRWRQGPPRPVYGIDYTFLRNRGPEPLRWGARTIEVRLAEDPPGTSVAETLRAVVAELRGITGLELDLGDPGVDPDQPPAGTIVVRFVSNAWIAMLRDDLRRPLSGATGEPDYSRGVVIVNTDLVNSDSVSRVLRHELAHALGLGHSVRPGSLMSQRLSDRPTDFTVADRHSLARLGSPT